ncbi:MAG TPA: DUF1269 domain-containing protein [Syntrophomonadaceae bacterium]|nr:DUF1269 domain-containing protein [Syntrophomonadaceae bacterium]
MEKKVIGYFEDPRQAEQAANELQEKGLKEISILGKDNRGKGDNKGKDEDGIGWGLSSATMKGGAIGGVAGLVVGAGLLAIPGIGPIIAMGPLAAALGGAATGGVAGALVDYGIPKEQSDFYETKIKEGNTVMIIKANEDKTDTIASILRNYGAKDVKID